MRTLTVLCNAVLFVITCLIVATEGVPNKAAYLVFTLLLMMIPVFTVFAIVRSTTERVAAVCNVVLLGFVCWALADQYPPPEGVSVVVFAVFTALTLVLSAAVLFRIGPRQGPLNPSTRA